MHTVFWHVHIDSVILWGFAASVIVTVIMQASQAMGFSRMSLPFILGSMFSPHRDRCYLVGFLVHLLVGWFIAFIYAAAFESLGKATWWLGMGISVVHGTFALTFVIPVLPFVHPRMASEYEGPTPTRMLEPPGFLALHYGRQTPLIGLIAHFAFGSVLGGFYQVVGT